MNLSKNKFILIFLSYLTVINLLIIYKINFLFLSSIISAIFFLIAPGILVQLILGIKNFKKGVFFVFSVGLSIAILLITGLISNWITPYLIKGTSHPISSLSLLTTFDVFILILVIVFAFRKLNKLTIVKPKLNIYSISCIAIPIIFLIFAIGGVISLNNGGSNLLILFSYLGIGFYLFFIFKVRKNISENIYPIALYIISLLFLFVGSLRSLHIASTDASLEYGIANFILDKGVWNYFDGNNNYYGMLSIVVLPAQLSLLLQISNLLVIKIIFPIIFSLLPVSIYYLFKKNVTSLFAFLAGIFFISQPNFAVWNLLPPRQELAFLFLGLIFLCLFTENLTKYTKILLLIIFGFCMLTSHYTTTYIALSIFTLVYLLEKILKLIIKWRNNLLSFKIYNSNKNIEIPGLALLGIFILFIWWYFLVTNVGYKSITLLEQKFTKDAFKLDKSPLRIFLGKKNILEGDSLNNYLKTISTQKISNYPPSLTNKYPSSYATTSEIKPINNYPLYFSLIEKIKVILLAIGGASLVVGIFEYIRSKKSLSDPTILFSFVSFGIVAMAIPLPFILGFYDPIRLYLQLLVFLSFFAINGFFFLCRSKERLASILFIFFTIFYFIFLTHIPYLFVGGNRAELQLTSVGKDYDFSYITGNEIKASEWLVKNNRDKSIVTLDSFAEFKLYQAENYNLFENVKIIVFPQTISTNDYVYASRANVEQGITFRYTPLDLLIYNFPNKFLNDNKDLIYSNSRSKIYK